MKKFDYPVLEVEKFDLRDVITTSATPEETKTPTDIMPDDDL